MKPRLDDGAVKAQLRRISLYLAGPRFHLTDPSGLSVRAEKEILVDRPGRFCSHYLAADDGDGQAEEIVDAHTDMRSGRNHGDGRLEVDDTDR